MVARQSYALGSLQCLEADRAWICILGELRISCSSFIVFEQRGEHARRSMHDAMLR